MVNSLRKFCTCESQVLAHDFEVYHEAKTVKHHQIDASTLPWEYRQTKSGESVYEAV